MSIILFPGSTDNKVWLTTYCFSDPALIQRKYVFGEWREAEYDEI